MKYILLYFLASYLSIKYCGEKVDNFICALKVENTCDCDNKCLVEKGILRWNPDIETDPCWTNCLKNCQDQIEKTCYKKNKQN